MNAAEVIVQALHAAGARALYGVPGGGSSLDLMAAARAVGMPFRLARTETGAAIMASVSAELSGAPTPVLTTRGPGVSAVANGIATASLERAPVVLLADGFTARERSFACHQFVDHAALLKPVTKAQLRAENGAGPVVQAAIAASLAAPRGPVLIELTGEAAQVESAPAAPFTPPPPRAPDADALATAQALLAKARRPAILVGLEAIPHAGALRALARALGCPVLVTYKAKGVFPDADPQFGGVFTGGVAEVPILSGADLIILAGCDPMEWVPQPWKFQAPVIDIAACPRDPHYLVPEAALTGDVGLALAALAGAAGDWTAAEIATHRAAWKAALSNGPSGNRGISPQALVEGTQAACRAAGANPRVAVDAGAHMFPCTSFWQAKEPGDLLISNGLATMGYAVPAGIAAALHDPARGAVAFTGDGGLLMCLGELATAAALKANLLVVVFNDATLSLIDIKKGSRALPEGGLDWPSADFATLMEGVGGTAWRVQDDEGLRRAVTEALAVPGPKLIDARTDASSYSKQIKALRG
jgi:acetolactate synthase-1/2/3 large subunit